MKRVLSGIIVILIVVLGRKAYGYYTKYKHAKGLKFDIEGFDFPNGFKISNLVNDVEVVIRQMVKNFTPSVFNIEQINIDVFTLSGNLIAEQHKPLKEPVVIVPNRINTFPIRFIISIHNMKLLIKEAGGALKVGANFLTTGKYGIPIHLKGFVVAEGVTIDIDEKLTI